MKQRNHRLQLPCKKQDLMDLSIGDSVYLSGVLFTARDAAHKLILQTPRNQLVFNPDSKGLYLCGPLMKYSNEKWVVISAGPTTSSRIDLFESDFLEKFPKIRLVIGKGDIGTSTKKILKERGVYLVYTGGTGALAADQITKVLDVFYLEELGMAEAIWVFEVTTFGPLIVASDINGNSIFTTKEVNTQ